MISSATMQTSQLTTREWVAGLLRSLATRFDGGTITPPTTAEIKREKLREAQLALIEAETEAERANHSVAMLKERVTRLGGTVK